MDGESISAAAHLEAETNKSELSDISSNDLPIGRSVDYGYVTYGGVALFGGIIFILSTLTGSIAPKYRPSLAMEVNGGVINATIGSVWPLPQYQNQSSHYMLLNATLFTMQISNHNCDLLRQAISRYETIIRDAARGWLAKKRILDSVNNGTVFTNKLTEWRLLHVLHVNLTAPCEDLPYLYMKEMYTLNVSNEAELKSESIWGILRGLETFSQLLFESDTHEEELKIFCTEIVDFPRYMHRGLLLDTARHYLPKEIIYQNLDAMAWNKLNVFHWHLVDDQSFPYQSKKFPQLSASGAFFPTMVYTPKDVQDIIEYARVRGIRVIPEFSSPGHSLSWGRALPDLLTLCYEKVHDVFWAERNLGPMNPSRNETYDILKEFFGEIAEVFPEKYIHIGGDEVLLDCWKSNPKIQTFMASIDVNNVKFLQDWFMLRLLRILKGVNASGIVWQDAFIGRKKWPKSTIVQVWQGSFGVGQMAELRMLSLLSTCWYLDQVKSGIQWTSFYECEPSNHLYRAIDERFLLGGEACMWSELVDESMVVSHVWPRTSATAERLWSYKGVRDIRNAARRIEEQYCRMKKRGVAGTPPNGPGFCI